MTSESLPNRFSTIITSYQETHGWMDGWMTCDFTSFSTVFQSYQDDIWMIMKGCVQWNSGRHIELINCHCSDWRVSNCTVMVRQHVIGRLFSAMDLVFFCPIASVDWHIIPNMFFLPKWVANRQTLWAAKAWNDHLFSWGWEHSLNFLRERERERENKL